jgi:DNA polymerase-1
VPKNATEVYNFLAVERPRVAVDVETDGKDPWTCRLRRIGIGTDREVMIYSPLSVRGHLMMHEHEIEACRRVIAGYFKTEQHLALHNGIGFDSIVLHHHGMPLRDDTCLDTLVAHQLGPTSELPHRLDFLGSMYTDAPFWKDSFKHSEGKDDATLDRYLSYDIAVTYLSEPYVTRNITWAQQEHIYNLDAELFRIGRSMSALGVWIDPETRWKFAAEYQEKSDRLRKEFTDVAGRDINPGSPKQIQKLLYHDLGLPMLDEHMTASGDPSTDEPTLLDLLSLGLDERGRKVIHALLGYREAEKLLGVNTGHIVDGVLVGGPIVHADGCVRAAWRPGKRSGRWGSNDPNLQNIPSKLRAMFRPTPNRGNRFVAADAQAQELRMIAMLSDDRGLIEAFKAFDEKRGPDVHTFNACTVFRCRPEDVTKAVRDLIKRFVYALSYDAQPPTIYRTLSLLRDDNLNPMFGHITLAEVERLYNLWWKLHPAIPDWKKKLIYRWRSAGFIGTHLHGRKRYFIGGESPTEMPNHDVQGSSASMQNDAIRVVSAAYPFDYVNHRGLLINGHDQLVVECAEREVPMVKQLLQTAMQKRIKDVLFPADPREGGDWKAAS